MTAGHRLTHIGLCVRDLQRSLDFYCTALGFERVGQLHVDDEVSARLLALTDLDLDLVYLQRDGVRLELLGYARPEPIGAAGPRAMNALGFTHLSFRVDDVDALSACILAHGGRSLTGQSVTFAGGNRGLMMTDPDGNLLELIERLPRP